jgi:hypothetical protein
MNFQRWPLGFGTQEDVRRKAPVADPHDPGAHADRHLVELAHALFRRFVGPAALDEAAHGDAVGDEPDVEDEQAGGREPESPLREPFARERTPNHPREGVPAETGRNEGPSADDHDMGVREVPNEMPGLTGAGEPGGRPGEILHGHMD